MLPRDGSAHVAYLGKEPWGALRSSWPLWRHGSHHQTVDLGCSEILRETAGPLLSWATPAPAWFPGKPLWALCMHILPCVSIGTKKMDVCGRNFISLTCQVLEYRRQCFLLTVKVWMGELLSCLTALNKADCPWKLKQSASLVPAERKYTLVTIEMLVLGGNSCSRSLDGNSQPGNWGGERWMMPALSSLLFPLHLLQTKYWFLTLQLGEFLLKGCPSHPFLYLQGGCCSPGNLDSTTQAIQLLKILL